MNAGRRHHHIFRHCHDNRVDADGGGFRTDFGPLGPSPRCRLDLLHPGLGIVVHLTATDSEASRKTCGRL